VISLLFVADGDLDEATIPALVGNLLGVTVRSDFRSWARLHGAGKGYARKLVFAVRQARDAGVVGLVATVDRDRDHKGSRIRALRDGRRHQREAEPAFPTAVGEAIPHAESWLLDDAKAVRDGLGLASDHPVTNVLSVPSPKEALIQLLRASPHADRSHRDAWRDVAARVKLERCVHARETGFLACAEDVRREIAPLVL